MIRSMCRRKADVPRLGGYSNKIFKYLNYLVSAEGLEPSTP